MRSVADTIEDYLQQVLANTATDYVEVRRNELAQIFQCAPSQINYVIGTRFTAEKGYLIESKRGGGGFIRIQKVSLHKKDQGVERVLNAIASSIPQVEAEHIISRFYEEGVMSKREALLIKRMLSRETLGLSTKLRDEARARLLRVVILTLIATKEGE